MKVGTLQKHVVGEDRLERMSLLITLLNRLQYNLDNVAEGIKGIEVETEETEADTVSFACCL